MIKELLLAVTLINFAPTIAHAGTVRGQDPSSVVSAMQAGGYKAIIAKDSTGDPRIESSAAGATFFVYFYGCTKNTNCSSVNFASIWSKKDVSLHQMNEWNKANRFSRAYLDKDGDPALEFDIDLDDGGMSEALFIDNIQYWELQIGNFKKHIGY